MGGFMWLPFVHFRKSLSFRDTGKPLAQCQESGKGLPSFPSPRVTLTLQVTVAAILGDLEVAESAKLCPHPSG